MPYNLNTPLTRELEAQAAFNFVESRLGTLARDVVSEFHAGDSPPLAYHARIVAHGMGLHTFTFVDWNEGIGIPFTTHWMGEINMLNGKPPVKIVVVVEPSEEDSIE